MSFEKKGKIDCRMKQFKVDNVYTSAVFKILVSMYLSNRLKIRFDGFNFIIEFVLQLITVIIIEKNHKP